MAHQNLAENNGFVQISYSKYKFLLSVLKVIFIFQFFLPPLHIHLGTNGNFIYILFISLIIFLFLKGGLTVRKGLKEKDIYHL